MSTCPNKNTPEWKTLVDRVGEKGAMTIFISNKYELPSMGEIDTYVDLYNFKEHQNKLYSPFAAYNPFDEFDFSDDSTIFDGSSTKELNEFSKLRIDVHKLYNNQQREIYNNTLTRLNKARLNNEFELAMQLEDELKFLQERLVETRLLSAIDAAYKPEDKITHYNLYKQSERDLEFVNKLLNKSNLDFADVKSIRDYIDFWTSAYERIIFDTSEPSLLALEPFYRDVSSKFQEIDNKLSVVEQKILENNIKHESGTEFNLREYLAKMRDINALKGNVLHLGRFGNTIMNHITKLYGRINQKAKLLFNTLKKENSDLSKKAMTRIKQLGFKDWNDVFGEIIFDRKLGKEVSTGNLIMPYSASYMNDKKKLLRKYLYNNDERSISNLKSWANRNEIIYDIRYLFPDNELMFISTDKDLSEFREKHIQNLIEHSSKEEVDQTLAILQDKIDAFKEDRNRYKDSLIAEGLTTTEIETKMFEFDIQYNPYFYVQFLKGKNNALIKNGLQYFPKGEKLTVSIPRKFITKIENGQTIKENLNHHNSKFDIIKNDTDLYNYWEYIMNNLQKANALFPPHITENLSINTLPFMQKELRNRVSELGLLGVTNAAVTNFFHDKMSTSREPEQAEVDVDFKGKEKFNLKVVGYTNTQMEIDKRFKLKLEQNKDKLIGMKEKNKFIFVAELKEEARQEVISKQSFDLPKLMDYINYHSILFDQKSELEPIIQMVDRIINNSTETITDSKGNMINRNGRIETKSKEDSFKNLKDALKFFTKHNFYAMSLDVSTSNDKTYNYDDKQIIKELDVEIKALEQRIEGLPEGTEKTVLQYRLQKLKDIKDTYGSRTSKKKIARIGMSYFYLISLGWNAVSGIANALNAIVLTTIHGASSLDYTEASYYKSYRQTLKSIADLWTFGLSSKVMENKTSKMMKNLGIFNAQSSEVLHGELGDTETKKRFNPYFFIESGEFLAQSQIMTAMMYDKKYIHNGQEITLFDMFNSEGVIDEEYAYLISLDELADFTYKVKEVSQRILGNYNPDLKIMAKGNTIYSIMLMFRNWMLEGFASRLEAEHYDETLGRNVKGRFRSAFSAYSKTNLYEAKLTIDPDMPDWKKAIYKKLSTDVDKKWEDYGIFGKFSYALKNLSLTIADFIVYTTPFINKDKYLNIALVKDSTEYGNLKANFREMHILMGIALSLLLLAKAGEDDDDESYLYYSTVNYLKRLYTEVGFYTSYQEFDSIVSNITPLLRIGDMVVRFWDALQKTMDGDTKYKRGINKGEYRLIKTGSAFIPGASQYYKTKNWGEHELKPFGSSK